MDNYGYYGYDRRPEQAPGPDIREIRRSYSRIGLAYLVFFLTALVSQEAYAYLMEGYRSAMGEELWVMFGLLSMYPLAFPLSYLIMRTVPKRGPTWQNTVGGPRFLVIFVICMGAMFAGNMIGQIMMVIVNLVTGVQTVNQVQELIGKMSMGTIFLPTVVAAPIVEEILFRKCILDRVICYGQLTAVLMSGVLFALAHGNFYQFFYAFALGAIFAYVYLRTGRIRYTIALHMLVNFLGSIVPMLAMKGMDAEMAWGYALLFGDMAMLMGSAVVGAVFLIIFRRQIWFRRTLWRVPVGTWIAAVCLNVGIILFFIYSVVSFVWL